MIGGGGFDALLQPVLRQILMEENNGMRRTQRDALNQSALFKKMAFHTLVEAHSTLNFKSFDQMVYYDLCHFITSYSNLYDRDIFSFH